MAKTSRRPSKGEREFYVYELDSRTGKKVPAKKPVQWAVSPDQAISRVRYAAYPGLSYRDLARKGVILVAEEKNENFPVPKESALPQPRPQTSVKPPVQTTFQF